jgi:hypothetical protein
MPQAGVPTELSPVVQHQGVTVEPLPAPIPPALVHVMPSIAGDGKQNEIVVLTLPTSPTRARHQSTRIVENIKLSSQQEDSLVAGPTQDTLQSSDGGNELVAADVLVHDSMEGHSSSMAAAAQDDDIELEEICPTEGEEDASHSLLVHPPSPTHASDEKQGSDDALEEPLSSDDAVEDSMEENFRIASPEAVPPTEVDEDPSHSLLVHPPSPTDGGAKRKRDEPWIEI